MIRHFDGLCKALLEKTIDLDIFIDATNRFKYGSAACPRCGAKGRLSGYGDYRRNLVSHSRGRTKSHAVRPYRFKCASCVSTHALLPDILVPYSPYTIRFKLELLAAYYEREATVEAICGRFGVAISTLYAWKKLFESHIALLLGVLSSLKEPALAFLIGLLRSDRLSVTLRGFFLKLGFSFMQRQPGAATRSRPP